MFLVLLISKTTHATGAQRVQSVKKARYPNSPHNQPDKAIGSTIKVETMGT